MLQPIPLIGGFGKVGAFSSLQPKVRITISINEQIFWMSLIIWPILNNKLTELFIIFKLTN
jgi:hypothetical protein